MQLRNLTNFPTDYLDAYCDAEVGHTNWAFAEYDRTKISSILDNPEVHSVVIIYNNPEDEDGEMATPEK